MTYEEFVLLNDRIEAGEPVSVEMMAEVFGLAAYDVVYGEFELDAVED